MADIRSLETISKKFQTVTPQRATQYKDGVSNPKRDWEGNTLEAGDRRDAAMQEAIADGRIDRGIKKAGNAKWKSQTVKMGPTRWQQGVSQAEAAYKVGFQPYHDVIASTTLSARYPAGDPRNYERSKDIGLALHNKKIQG